MTPLEGLAHSAADYLLVSFTFAVVTATLLVAAEELGARRLINGMGVGRWVSERRRRVDYVPPSDDLKSRVEKTLSHLPISPSSYALPYKQLVAVIASLVQADLRSGSPYSIAEALSLIGKATMADTFLPTIERKPFFPGPPSNEPAEADLLFFAERALDDLQAYLALYTARARYSVSVAAVGLQMLVLWLQRIEVVGAPILGSILLYPTAIFAAVLFAPVLRDGLERLSPSR